MQENPGQADAGRTGAKSASRRALRAGLLLACFGLGLGTVVWGGIAWLRDARLGRPTLVFNYSRMMAKRLPRIAAARQEGRPAVAVLGASGLVSYPEGRRVPDRLQQRLGVPVESLGMPGSGPFEYYFLADEIADAGPAGVVVAVNLDHFSDAWQGAYARPQLAGRIGPARLVEAFALPLHAVGLTADRLLYYVALVQAGGYEPWYWLTLRQAQLGRARDQLEAWLQGGRYEPRNDSGDDTPERRFRQAVRATTIERVFTGPDIRHYRASSVREHYAAILDGLDVDHPVLQVLDATIARLRRDGIPVLVYVEPIEVDYLAQLGLVKGPGLSESLGRIEAVVRGRGATFVDLHALLPPEAFRDAPGHLAYDGALDGPAALADALAPRVRDALADANDD